MKPAYLFGIGLFAVASFLAGRWHNQPAAASTAARRVLYYRDPMHPSYTSDKPGTAPDCGMPLEPVFAGIGRETKTPPARGVYISPEKQQLLGVRTAAVQGGRGHTLSGCQAAWHRMKLAF